MKRIHADGLSNDGTAWWKVILVSAVASVAYLQLYAAWVINGLQMEILHILSPVLHFIHNCCGRHYSRFLAYFSAFVVGVGFTFIFLALALFFVKGRLKLLVSTILIIALTLAISLLGKIEGFYAWSLVLQPVFGGITYIWCRSSRRIGIGVNRATT